MKAAKKGLFIFWLAAVADIFINITGNEALRFYAKPLIIPALMLYYYYAVVRHNNLSRLFLLGLFFSFAGDVFLLWDNYFIPGLICFLITHLIYIIYFIKTANQVGFHLKKYPLLVIPVVAYAMSLLWILLPSLGTLTLPVVIYATVISAMLLAAINLFKKMAATVYFYYITGAVLFVLSDSLLALNKFYHPFPMAGISIMVTYILAQYLITKGSINQLAVSA